MELPAPLAVSASSDEGRCHDALWTSGGGGGPEGADTDNEVLVRVRASSVCFGDRILRSGPLLIRLLSGFRPRHSILGVDLAGTVETIGPGVTRFAPGDAVYGARGAKFAAHAEFACVAEDAFLARKPATMTFEEAGTVFVGAACSLYFLRRANVKPGERVLVHGASGSLGVFAVQLAKHFGAHVTAVCSSANVHLVRSLGADDVIDYTARDFTDGGPVHDVIVDVLGKAGFPRSLRALKPGGHYLLVGFSGGLGGIARALVTGALVHLSGRHDSSPAQPIRAGRSRLPTGVDRRRQAAHRDRAPIYARRDRRSAPLRRYRSQDWQRRGADRCGSSAARARDVRATGSSPSHRLELRRPGSGQASTYAVDVRCRDVDAQQDGALSDRSLQGFGRFLW